jgi:hypothetical protein
MKKLLQIIKSNWRELIIAIFMVFVAYELIQIRSDLSYLEGDVSSIQSDVSSIDRKAESAINTQLLTRVTLTVNACL